MEFFESTVFRVICGCVLVGAFSTMVYMVVRLKKVSGRSQGTAPPPAPQPPAVFLTGRGGAMDQCRFQLPGSTLCIGTDPERCAIIYPPETEGIDPVHCQLILRTNGWSLVDFSQAGTYLRGERLEEGRPYLLMEGDVFWLAGEENSFCIQEG